MDGRMEQREREKQEREGGWMDRLMDGWIWRLMDERMDGWMDGWIDQYGKMGG